MNEAKLSRGDRRLLKRLAWIGGREGCIRRTQKQLGKALGGLKRDVSGKLVPRDVSDSMVRRHLRNLHRWVEVEQGGDGQPACYYFTAELPAEFGSGLSRELFRAELSLSSSVEKLKNTSGLDVDDEKSTRVAVSPRASGVPFPEASRLSPSESESRRQPHPNPEVEMRLRLQERHPAKWEDCLAVIRKALRKFPLNWAEFLALDDHHTKNPSVLTNPPGYYFNLASESVKEATAALREKTRVPLGVKEAARCTKCEGGFGVMADGRLCDCAMGKDLANLERRKQARADAEQKEQQQRIPIQQNTSEKIEKLQALADRAGTEHEAALANQRIAELRRKKDVA